MRLIVLLVALATAVIQISAHSHEPVHCVENRFNVHPPGKEKKTCPLEEHVNNQINMELRVFYEYLNLGYFFAHESYSLPYFSKYFLKNAEEELKHAQDLMQYLVLRGAYVKLTDIASPPKRTFTSSCDAMNHAYELERNVTKQIEHIWRDANNYYDVHLADHLETTFVTEQYESLKKLKDMIGTLKRLGVCNGEPLFETCDKLGEFQFDKIVMKDLTSS